MIILKHSYLHSNRHLVKILKEGKYGIYNITDERVVVEPYYDYIECQNDGQLLAKKDGYYFYIDNTGERISGISIAEEVWDGVEKSDTCPTCSGDGAACCYGFGFIPAKGDWEEFLRDLD